MSERIYVHRKIKNWYAKLGEEGTIAKLMEVYGFDRRGSRNWIKDVIEYGWKFSMKQYELDKIRRHVQRHKRQSQLQKRLSRIYGGMKQRCNNPGNHAYRYYGARGIKVLMTPNDLRLLWERDKAHLFKRPSVDRIDNNGHYSRANCRFIESSDNVKKAFADRRRLKEAVALISVGGR